MLSSIAFINILFSYKLTVLSASVFAVTNDVTVTGEMGQGFFDVRTKFLVHSKKRKDRGRGVKSCVTLYIDDPLTYIYPILDMKLMFVFRKNSQASSQETDKNILTNKKKFEKIDSGTKKIPEILSEIKEKNEKREKIICCIFPLQ